MDTVSTAKVQINFKDGTINLEGSEEFVKSQMEWLKELIVKTPIQQAVQVVEKVEIDESTKEIETTTNHQAEEKNSVDRYKTVFGVEKEIVELVIHIGEDGKISIITKNIKGGNAEKQVSYSLLYLLAKEFYGEDEASFEELRELCENNDCLDTKNFATCYSRHKELFIVNGQKRSRKKTVKLTAPGRSKARELIVALAQRG